MAVRDAALQESHMEKRELRRQLSTKETEVQATAIEVRCATNSREQQQWPAAVGGKRPEASLHAAVRSGLCD